MVAVVVQSAFRLEIHQNDIFLFFKNYFWDQHIKTIWKHKKKKIFSKKKKNWNLRERGWNRVPKRSLMFGFCALVAWYVVFFFSYWEIADIDLATITDRMAAKKAVQCGNVEDAIEKVNDLNPEVRCFTMLLQSLWRWLVGHLFAYYYPYHSLLGPCDYIVCLINIFSWNFSFSLF